MFEIDGQFQLIMEYVDGKNARRVGRRPARRRCRSPAAARIGVQLLVGARARPRQGLRPPRHQAVEPAGDRARPRGRNIKLSDFGLAKSFRDNAGFAGLTHQGDIGGSVGFISPDHIRDFREVKEPADIYSAGATLYYLLTGKYPFLDFDPNRADAYAMILEHPPGPAPGPPARRARGPRPLLRKALEKQPRDRWKSAAAMADALRPFLDGPA